MKHLQAAPTVGRQVSRTLIFGMLTCDMPILRMQTSEAPIFEILNFGEQIFEVPNWKGRDCRLVGAASNGASRANTYTMIPVQAYNGAPPHAPDRPRPPRRRDWVARRALA